MAITKLPRNAIADDAINASKIEDGTVAITEVSGTITNAKLKDGDIANSKLSNSTFTARGVSRALGDSFTIGVDVDWQSVVTSNGSTVTTMEAGRGYFVDNSSAAGLVKLPSSASTGDTIAIKDYSGSFGSNSLTIQRNGHNIQGVANDSNISTNRASVVLVYADSTKGWLFTNEHNVADLQKNQFTAATGGTVLTNGDFKTHVFTGDGCFVVSQSGTGTGPSTVDYLVVAGGGGGGRDIGGGGGAGGFRMFVCGSPNPLKAPAAHAISAQTYPITVGAGGSAGSPSSSNSNGSNSVFSTLTSAGGGAGGGSPSPQPNDGDGAPGGSGGGTRFSGTYSNYGGTGNTPPVSPPQGNPGGGTAPPAPLYQMGGGGGAGAAGATVNSSPHGPETGANGGNGSFIPDAYMGPTAPSYGTPGPVSSTRYFAGGGGGGGYPTGRGTGGKGGGAGAPFANGTANTGGGGVGGQQPGPDILGSNGGKGIVMIRYKFQ